MTSIIKCIQSILSQHKFLKKIVCIAQTTQFFYTDTGNMFAGYINVWDLGCIIMLALSGITGYCTGFIVHTGKWLGLLACAVTGLHLIQIRDLYHWQAIALYFAFVICTWAVILIILGRLSTFISKSHISFLNKILGAIGGVLHGALIIFCMFAVASKLKAIPPEILSSSYYQFYIKLLEVIITNYPFIGSYLA